jgi:hypothetical protein
VLRRGPAAVGISPDSCSGHRVPQRGHRREQQGPFRRQCAGRGPRLRLAYPCIANECNTILVLAAEYVNNMNDLIVPADHWIHFASRHRHIPAILPQACTTMVVPPCPPTNTGSYSKAEQSSSVPRDKSARAGQRGRQLIVDCRMCHEPIKINRPQPIVDCTPCHDPIKIHNLKS